MLLCSTRSCLNVLCSEESYYYYSSYVLQQTYLLTYMFNACKRIVNLFSLSSSISFKNKRQIDYDAVNKSEEKDQRNGRSYAHTSYAYIYSMRQLPNHQLFVFFAIDNQTIMKMVPNYFPDGSGTEFLPPIQEVMSSNLAWGVSESWLVKHLNCYYFFTPNICGPPTNNSQNKYIVILEVLLP